MAAPAEDAMTWDEAVHRVETLAAGMAELFPADAAALRLLLANAIPREDRERALALVSEASSDGLGLVGEIDQHVHDPWRWNYPNVYMSDEYAHAAAMVACHEARAARRLLKLDTEDRDA